MRLRGTSSAQRRNLFASGESGLAACMADSAWHPGRRSWNRNSRRSITSLSRTWICWSRYSTSPAWSKTRMARSAVCRSVPSREGTGSRKAGTVYGRTHAWPSSAAKGRV